MKDERVLVGYCSIFSKIMSCLRDGRLPTSTVVDRQIRESWRDREAKLFLDAGGKSRYVLEYLIDFVEELMLKQREVIFADDRYLPICMNDSYYGLLREKLYKN
jgi:6-phosphogluconolactonase/glucosamine-6-phosphate isomerase/deaminase